MEFLSPTLSLAAILAFIGFAMWLRQQRRLMIHRERLAALEKGVDLPQMDKEVHLNTWNVQRLLLLASHRSNHYFRVADLRRRALLRRSRAIRSSG